LLLFATGLGRAHAALGPAVTRETAMTIALITLAALAVALGYYGLRPARRVQGVPLGSCRCPHCNQKLRYRAGQVERRMLCPRCVRGFTVPVGGGLS
jgi:hypothetical protein